MDIIPRFHDAAWSGPIANGFEYISNVLLPKSDVLIYSDPNHYNSQNIIPDMFSQERLVNYSEKGGTDIYIEEVESLDPYQQLLACGDIKHDEFIRIYGETSHNPFYTEAENVESRDDISKAIESASNMDTPIRFHFVRISNTDEQDGILSGIREQASACERDAYDSVRAFFKLLKENNIDFNGDDKYVVFNMLEEFDAGMENSHNRSYIEERYNTSFCSILSDNFGDKVPTEMLKNLSDKLNEMREQQISVFQSIRATKNKFRIDNDATLAEEILRTKDPDGKAIVVHGRAHGAETHNDLDEHLQRDGLVVNRVNIFYDPNDLPSNRIDNSDMNYSPETNGFYFIDWNKNGIVDGGSNELSPFELKSGDDQLNSTNIPVM